MNIQLFNLLIRKQMTILAGSIVLLLSFSSILPNTFRFMKVDRKQVSHILIENFGGNNSVSMIVHHNGIWAFHATSHALRHSCQPGPECISLMKKLNKHLVSGRELGLHLSGSKISRIDYY